MTAGGPPGRGSGRAAPRGGPAPLTAGLERTGPSALLTIKLNRLLCDWLREHVASTDKVFGGFLQTAGVAASA